MTHYSLSSLSSSFSLNPINRYSSNLDSKNPPSPTASLPVSSLLFSSSSQEFLRNVKWVSRKNRYYLAKPADQDIGTREPSPQVSGENAAASSSTADGNASTSFLSILCPLLRLFSGGDPSQERNHALEVATSSLSSLARFPWGSKSLSGSLESQDVTISDPPMRMQLFEFEACPFCRRIREALTELDLSVEVYPCPKGSIRHREMVRSFGGKEQFPFLIDPNTEISMYESGDIVKYLFTQYGKGRNPSMGLLERYLSQNVTLHSTLFTGWMPTILRAGRGMMLWDKARQDPPPRKLELFSCENNPYSRIVREALCELELPYILQNVGEGSRRTKLLLDASGSKEIPYMIDPNTGTQIGDYKKILTYLFKTYSVATV
ncbi:Thioredoxin family protein isoform 2 [Theobroma cacao]|uniref:Thioredoxin family protein isoform 2 n=1 Tax=Theobroma cacao TaxID=3641 RepID=A0A061FJF4_THECC|nr:Thioredoxin family protein isoform 2 [Theobroma cacao]